MFSPVAVPKHEIKYTTPKRIPREIGDQARRDLVRDMFAYFDGTHRVDLNFNRYISDERATRLADWFFGQLWHEHGLKLIVLGVLVQHKGGTHIHIFARDKETSRHDLPEPTKKQVFLRDMSAADFKRLEKLWSPFGRKIKKGALIRAIRSMESSLIYNTCERNIPSGGNPIFYVGLNRSIPLKIIKKFTEEWEAKLDLVAEEAECDAAYKKRSPAPVIPFPIPERTAELSKSPVPSPAEPMDTVPQLPDTVTQLSADQFLEELNEAIRQADTVTQVTAEELLKEIDAGLRQAETAKRECNEFEEYSSTYFDVLSRLFDEIVKAMFPLRQKQKYAALKTNEKRRTQREEIIRRAIRELSAQGERITRKGISSITGIPVWALSRPHYKHLFEP